MPPNLIRELVTGFDRGRAQQDLADLCAPTFAGRRIGTAGHDRAQAWLAGRMGALGLAVAAFDFTLEQPVLDLHAPPTLDTITTRGEVLRSLLHRREFAEHPRSADCPTVDAGPARRWHPDDDLRGAWVILEQTPPGQELMTLADQLGALGLLLAQAVGEDDYLIKVCCYALERAFGNHRDPHRVSVADLTRVYAADRGDAVAIRRLLQVDALPEGWRSYLEQQLAELVWCAGRSRQTVHCSRGTAHYQRTGFLSAFTHLNEREAFVDELAVSLCAILLADACT